MNKTQTVPFVCFTCRKQFERHWDGKENLKSCPICNDTTYRYDVRFKVPKMTDDGQWKKVEFLRQHGFYFQNVYDIVDSFVKHRASYPKTYQEAQEFVVKYKSFALEY